MVSVETFRAEMEVELDKLEVHLEDTVKEAFQLALAEIVSQWPVYSAYSFRNIYVSKTNPVEEPQPERRAPREGAYINEAFAQMDANYDTIDDFKLNKTRDTRLYISNPVFYADDVGFEPGRGSAIFANAAMLAEALIQERLDDEILHELGSFVPR